MSELLFKSIKKQISVPIYSYRIEIKIFNESHDMKNF